MRPPIALGLLERLPRSEIRLVPQASGRPVHDRRLVECLASSDGLLDVRSDLDLRLLARARWIPSERRDPLIDSIRVRLERIPSELVEQPFQDELAFLLIELLLHGM